VRDDGAPDCKIPAATGVTVSAQTSGNGAFSCSYATAGTSKTSSATVMLSVLLGLVLWSRRRRQK
jgi:MYXO-CTERM domain-containing protein